MKLSHLLLSGALLFHSGYMGKKERQQKLVEKLCPREHIGRTDTEYDHSPAQLYELNDGGMLYLIEKYVDHLDNLKKEDFVRYFPRQYSDEQGGLIFNHLFSMEMKSFVNTTESDTCGQRLQYFNDSLHNYFRRANGMFHTHPRFRCDTAQQAGPSGNKFMQVHEFFAAVEGRAVHGDMESLRAGLATNRTRIDMVISEVDTLAYNVDLYFSNPESQNKEVTIIDVGTYRFKE